MSKIENYVLPSQEDFYVMGLPLKTDYGNIRQIKVKEYPFTMQGFELLKMAEWQVKESLKKQIKGIQTADSILSDLSTKPLIHCVQTNILGLRNVYNDIFSKIIYDFDGGKFYEQFTSQDEWENFRKLILAYNGISYVELNPNPRIRHFQKLEIYYNQRTGKSVDFDAIFTSLIAVGIKPHDINDFTLYQFYQAFHRLQAFKMYDTTTLYKTVDSKGTIDIIEWFKSSREKKSEDRVYNSREEIEQSKESLAKAITKNKK